MKGPGILNKEMIQYLNKKKMQSFLTEYSKIMYVLTTSGISGGRMIYCISGKRD